MMLFAIGIERSFDVPVQGLHDADARKHGRPAVAFGDHDQDFNGRPPLLEFLFGRGELLDIFWAASSSVMRPRRASMFCCYRHSERRALSRFPFCLAA